MPYNTRRKSLSLPSLGIQLPNTTRRSPSISKTPPASDDHLPPSKRAKTAHPSRPASPDLTAAPSKPGAKGNNNLGSRLSHRRGAYEHTPPPSPTDATVASKIDTEGINDDIVVAVIEQLEKTGNRPHLVKELAAVLLNVNESVSNSANPAALLSSRLSTYLKRPWTALAPCPVAKELVPVHPRKVYYYLTTAPRQPIPDKSDEITIPRLDAQTITPSASSVEHDEEDALARDRARLSPSPEVDLSSPDFDDDETDVLAHRVGSSRSAASGSTFPDARNPTRVTHPHRAASPPLEGDEREFTQTASAVRERASEEKANRLQNHSENATPAATQPPTDSPHGNMAASQSVVEARPTDERMADSEYGDYFSHANPRSREQDPDEAAAVALFGTSPSPSLVSVASSISSGTSIDTGADLDTRQATPRESADDADLALLGDGPSSSVEGIPVPISPLKRSIDMLNSGFPEPVLKMSDLYDWDPKFALRRRNPSDMDVDVAQVPDSWIELRSPETVEVDELDEMFGDM